MGDRDYILKKLLSVQIQEFKSDINYISRFSDKNLVKEFIKNLSLNGGMAKYTKRTELNKEIKKILPDSGPIVSLVENIEVSPSLRVDSSEVHKLNHLKLLIINGIIGVGENGAIWLTEYELMDRRMPFITDHVIIIIRKRNIVPDLMEAYRKIDLSKTGYGIFIAGPSKTADIEQSLVIGAQGSSHHTVIVTD